MISRINIELSKWEKKKNSSRFVWVCRMANVPRKVRYYLLALTKPPVHNNHRISANKKHFWLLFLQQHFGGNPSARYLLFCSILYLNSLAQCSIFKKKSLSATLIQRVFYLLSVCRFVCKCNGIDLTKRSQSHIISLTKWNMNIPTPSSHYFVLKIVCWRIHRGRRKKNYFTVEHLPWTMFFDKINKLAFLVHSIKSTAIFFYLKKFTFAVLFLSRAHCTKMLLNALSVIVYALSLEFFKEV